MAHYFRKPLHSNSVMYWVDVNDEGPWTESNTFEMKYRIAKYNETGIVIRANCQKILRSYIEYFEQKILFIS